MFKYLLLFLVLFNKCFGFDLDDLQYDKMPPLFSLDDYHRCLLHNGTYCVVKVELFAEPENELIMLMKVELFQIQSHKALQPHQEKGVCLPTTCKRFLVNKTLDSPADLKEILDQCNNQSIFEEYGLEARVSDIFYCDKAEDQGKDKPNLLDWAVLAAILGIILLNITATIYDLKLSETSRDSLTKGQEILSCFSMRNNWNHLCSKLETLPTAPNFDGINFMRVSASFMMVLGHVLWIFTMGFIDNPHDFERAYNVPHTQVLFNGMIVVQIFFVVSGFLMIYNLEQYLDTRREPASKVITKTLIVRYFRLAPALSVMLAFTATWLRFAGTGPLWNRHVTPVVNDCRKYWWTHLLFINNYVKENKFCAIQTWHIGADTQMFFIAITLYLMTKYHHRMLLMSVLLLISFVLPALHVYFQDLDAVLIKTPEFLRTLENPNFNEAYVLGHNNISCFVLGMMTAYKLNQWQKHGVVFKGKFVRYVFRLCVPLAISCFLASCMFYEEDYRTPLWARILFQSTHRFLFGLPIAFLIVGLGMNFDRVLERFMSWHGFVVMGRLTYCVYICHMNFTHIIAGSKTQLEHFSYLDLTIYQLGIILLSYLVSVPFYLMVEAPAPRLMKMLMRPTKAKVDKKGLETVNEQQDEVSAEEKTIRLLEESVRDTEIKKVL